MPGNRSPSEVPSQRLPGSSHDASVSAPATPVASTAITAARESRSIFLFDLAPLPDGRGFWPFVPLPRDHLNLTPGGGSALFSDGPFLGPDPTREDELKVQSAPYRIRDD